MDGVIDLSGISRVEEVTGTGAGYAFETETWDNRVYVLSAVTAGIRSNWISAIRRTAGLPELPASCRRDDAFPANKELPLLAREDSVEMTEATPLTPVTPRSALFSSDDEYRTASEGGRRDSADWGDAVVQLSPSPVLNRTPISKVKEKVRARGCNHQPPPTSPLSDTVSPSDCDEVDATKDKNDEIVSPFPCIKEIAKSESGTKTYKRSYISTIDKQSIEIEDLRKQLKMALSDVSSAETELSRLRKVKSDSVLREKKMEELLSTLQKTEEELLVRTKEAENIDAIKQLYNQDKNMWECKLNETQNFLRESTEHCELLTRQLTSGQETIEHLQQELNNLNEKLHRSIKENDGLYAKIRDLELRGASLSPSKEKRKSIGSLSELTNINLDMNFDSMDKDHLKEEYVELRSRFLKAIQEIKVMKKELRESHGLYDELEVANIALRSEMKLREENNKSEMNMMADRIQDLTQKLTASDKQVRALKHKLQKSESREKRRSLSLKGRESFSIGKEVEEKLSELENKILILESAGADKTPVINSPSKAGSPAKEKSPKRDECTSDEKKLKRLAARLRRKSLDSATSSEPMKMLVRLSSLETKVSSALEGRKELATSCESLSQATRSTNSPTCIDSPEGSTAGTHSQKHLLDRLQSLENVVILSRNKVNECICQMSSLRASKSRRSPSPGIDKKHSIKSIEKCLADVSKTLQDCFDKCVVECEHGVEPDVSDTVAAVVQQLEEQLRDKLLEISRKKSALLESGELDQRKNLELLAEKLAYEAVLVGRIQEALESSNGSRFFARLIKSEIDETSQLIETLRAKVNGTHSTKVLKNKSSMDYLAKILSRKIDIMNSNGETKTLRKSELIIQSGDMDLLKASQKEIAAAVDKFKSEKLAELSAALASETLNCASSNDVDCEQQRTNAEAARVREAWAAARDALGAELVQAEVARALARAAHACEGRLLDTRNGRLTLTAQDRADLELWWQAAHDHLRCEMDVAVRDIATRYRESLASASRRPSPEPGAPRDSRTLLQQLADVLAHKALVDARIAVVDGTYRASLPDDGTDSNFSTLIQDVNRRSSEAENVVSSLDSDPTQEAEFIYLFQHFSNECRALFSSDCSSNSEDLMKISQSLEQVETKVKQVQRQLSGQDEDSPKEEELSDQSTPSDCTQLQSVFDRCESLKRRVEALSTLVPCKHCKLLQDALDRLKSERSRGETALQQQAGALAAARRARQQLQAQHERERQQLRERARRLERRLATLDSEYSQQLENLRAAYHNTLATDLQGDGLRARYQAEIEQLRALCEKGLLAMESSHRRIVHEMEEKHRAEREQLRLDKEAALAEETRATLAALDAMRKAHESEVRREVDKFKADYLGRGSVAPPVGQLNSRHQQEMEEIKQEILSLSEKYSVKCVESAALEESLANATQQLAQAQQHIMQLDARNKQLRAHLVSEANEIKNAEASTLPLLIEDTSPHGQSAQGSPLWAHLRHLAAVWQKANQQESNTTESTEPRARDVSSEKDKDTVCKNRKHKELATVPSTELKNTRCSVPGRASFSPLVGMVAERKKRFEV